MRIFRLLKLYCNFRLSFFYSQVWINEFKQIFGLIRHYAPIPNWSLWCWTFTSNGDTTTKFCSQPIDQLFISVCYSYIEKVMPRFTAIFWVWFLLINSYATISIQKTSQISQSFFSCYFHSDNCSRTCQYVNAKTLL